MSIFALGTLSTTPTHKSERVDLTNPTDIYKFTVPKNADSNSFFSLNASIHQALDGSTSPVTPRFKIFEDSNKDGVLTTSGVNVDRLVSIVDSNSIFNEGPINFATHSGTYFALVERNSSSQSSFTSYQVDFSVTQPKTPSNLIPVKLPLGELNKTQTLFGRIDNANTSDVYSFSLASGKAATVFLTGMDIGDDLDLRIINDNGDRIFDSSELVSLSTKGGNSAELLTLNAPGNYLVQVYQFAGSTPYNISFGTSTGTTGSNLTGIKVASPQGGTLHGNSRDSILAGRSKADKLYGHDGNDTLLGNAGRDVLVGGADDDQLFGGKGKDILNGNAGRDTFILARQNGRDLFKDFHVGEDYLGLANNLTFAQLSFTQTKQGTLVKAGNESLAFLKGVDRNQLSASSFVQVDLAKLTANVAGLV